MPNRFEGYISNFIRQRRLQLGPDPERSRPDPQTASPRLSISLLESGERRLDLDRIPRLADALDAERFALCASALRDRCPQLFAEIFSSVESVAAAPEWPQCARQGGAACAPSRPLTSPVRSNASPSHSDDLLADVRLQREDTDFSRS